MDSHALWGQCCGYFVLVVVTWSMKVSNIHPQKLRKSKTFIVLKILKPTLCPWFIEQHHHHNYTCGMVIRIGQYMVDPSVSSSHFDSPRHNITISGSRSKRFSLYCLWVSLLEKVMNPVSGRRTHLSVTAQLLVEMLSSFHFLLFFLIDWDSWTFS